IGADTLVAVESVRGTNFTDTYDATGFVGFNEFEGTGGNDNIIGNGNTRITFVSATGGVTVDIAAGTATGDASVGSDTFTGVADVLGSGFNDRVTGDAAGNILNCAFGNDSLTGNGGSDTFRFDSALSASNNVDTVTDFDVPADTIQLDNAVFTA